MMWEGEGFCATCKLDSVHWRRAPRGRHLVHDGGLVSCRFPCRTCDHEDCAAARLEMKVSRVRSPRQDVATPAGQDEDDGGGFRTDTDRHAACTTGES